jgi:hypothetical protein
MVVSTAATPMPHARGTRCCAAASYIAFLLAVFGSFFVTLWLAEPQVSNTPDNRSYAQRLAAHPISNGSDLAKSAYEADLIPPQRLAGHVEAIRRIDEQRVDLVGWAADGDGTALGDGTVPEVLIFVAGHLVATGTLPASDRTQPPHSTWALVLRKMSLCPQISLAAEVINQSW